LMLMASNGGLTAFFAVYQEHRTIRQYNTQILMARRWTLADPTQTPDALPEPTTAFVPAIPRVQPSVKADATNFVLKLFDTQTGQSYAHAITPRKGQIQVKSPSVEAVHYLESLGIVRVGDNSQLYWNHVRVERGEMILSPTLTQAYDALRTGYRTPSLEGGEGGGLGA
jgi:hypothetical protein